MRALVIDDSRAMRRIVSSILEGIGFEVRDAGNGREGNTDADVHAQVAAMEHADSTRGWIGRAALGHEIDIVVGDLAQVVLGFRLFTACQQE